jgi:hypothetical protein
MPQTVFKNSNFIDSSKIVVTPIVMTSADFARPKLKAHNDTNPYQLLGLAAKNNLAGKTKKKKSKKKKSAPIPNPGVASTSSMEVR